MYFLKKATLPARHEALPGRQEEMAVPEAHFVNGKPLREPFPAGLEKAVFGLGCFWGAEKRFWETPDVFSTAVGYAGGFTENPSYEEVCSGMTGHNEVVLVIYDPELVSYGDLLKVFWESHDPTQGMRQGNDHGTQYRSSIFTCNDAQRILAEASRQSYGQELANAGFGAITTEILPNSRFYYAEAFHQQYLAKNPGGYCGSGGLGLSAPIPEIR
ncbi:MAG: peptide-methionine (S)-S-oxide reductase MsrA [Pseudomonadales bacterium]|nr:peptide-methionine (S)-S-oxide reductase MsrA [Pseudomonadales bacterium]